MEILKEEKLLDEIKILHVCKNYNGSKLYDNLFRSLNQLNIQQTVFVSTTKSISKKELTGISSESELYCLHIVNNLQLYDKIFYSNKIKKCKKWILNNLSSDNIDIIHAHTLFSDGGVAYSIKKKWDIPYIVTIRNSDVNFFYKYFIHLRSFAQKILLGAEKIIFLSPAYLNKCLDLFPNYLYDEILEKKMILSNGIDKQWYENNVITKSKKQGDKFNLIYVGRIRKNKNIKRIIELFIFLKDKGIIDNLYLIGFGFDINSTYEKEIKNKYRQIQNLHFVNYINNSEELKIWFKKSDIFIMPSFYESFGLGYIEALSQGVPIIYSKNEGIDGYFQEGRVGYAVDPYDFNDIVEKVLLVIKNYNLITRNLTENIKQFNWDNIAENYRIMYEKIYLVEKK